MFKHVFLPTDGSPLCAEGVTKAIAFAASIGARVTAFHARPTYPDMRHGETGVMAPVTPEGHQAQMEDKAKQLLAGVAAQCAKAGVACETLSVVNDYPAKAIVQLAQEVGADLIAMASHGRSGLNALLMGSETRSVLTRTHLPVLVFK